MADQTREQEASSMPFRWERYGETYRVIDLEGGLHITGRYELHMLDEIERLRAEAERLRGALKSITTHSHEVVNGYWRVEDVYMTAGRAALAREDGDGLG